MTEKPQYTGKMLDELFAKVDDALEARSDSARTGENGRQLCSPEHPMPKDALGRWEHTNVKEVGECMDGCCADYQCQDCGHKWREELPQ
jgi:hypothetical protein